ncbi:acetate uptake transporter [Patulibacter minatonensis]|uniref:acetate uptake transporter n=1 Tax=Patulibacter minatonensis TaxID=298163 RepID=UPI00047E6A1B|nr:GPR1/FUN34/YaaH family transporter [Patulibacter minatonensis]
MATAAPAAPTNGLAPRTAPVPPGTATGRLSEKVINSPEGGAGVFYAATAAGTALILGCLGVALALLSAGNVELYDPKAGGVVIPAAFAVGGLGIGTGGLWNFRAGNLFAGTLGVMYGTLWLSLGLMLLTTGSTVTEAAGPASFGDAFGTYLLLWAIVSFGLGAAAWFVAKMVFAAQMLLGLTILCLALGNMAAPGGSGLVHLGGVLGLITAASVLYVSMAMIINDTAGKDVLPIV